MEKQNQIILRNVEYDDLKRFYQILQNPSVFSKIDLLGPPSMEAEIQWFIAIENNKELVWTIEYNGIIIGNCRIFSDGNLPKNSAEFGIMIDEAYWGMGIGTFVCQWLIKYAKEQLQLDQLFLEVKKDNNHAKKLYKKIGFQPFKTTSTHEMMVMNFRQNKGGGNYELHS